MDQNLTDLEQLYQRTTGDTVGFEREFMIVHRAGDDINCVCNAKECCANDTLVLKNYRISY